MDIVSSGYSSPSPCHSLERMHIAYCNTTPSQDPLVLRIQLKFSLLVSHASIAEERFSPSALLVIHLYFEPRPIPVQLVSVFSFANPLPSTSSSESRTTQLPVQPVANLSEPSPEMLRSHAFKGLSSATHRRCLGTPPWNQ